MGSAVSQYLASIDAKDQVSWHMQPAGLFPNGPRDIAHAVVEEKCWVAIVSASKASSLTPPIIV